MIPTWRKAWQSVEGPASSSALRKRIFREDGILVTLLVGRHSVLGDEGLLEVKVEVKEEL